MAVAARGVVIADLPVDVDVVSELAALPLDIGCVQDALLVPVLEGDLEVVRVAQLGDEAWEVSRFLFE